MPAHHSRNVVDRLFNPVEHRIKFGFSDDQRRRERDRIFDRYYCVSHSASNAPGTGIGLSVAKQAAQAHGGHVWVTSTIAGVTTFYASFPNCMEGGAAL